MVVKIKNRAHCCGAPLTSTADLDILLQSRQDARAKRLMDKLLKKQGYAPRGVVTDKLGS